MTTVAVVLLWCAAFYRVALLRGAVERINVTYAAATVAIAVAFTIKAAEAVVDRLTAPYVSDLLEHGFVVLGGVAAQLFLLALRTGRPPRRAATNRVLIAVTVLVTMTVLFAAAPIHAADVGDLDEVFGNLDLVCAYRLIFGSYLTYVLIDNVRLCRRYAAEPGDPGRTASLALVGWGSCVCLAYSGSRVIYAATDLAFDRQPETVRTVGSAAAAVGLCSLAVGVVVPRLVRAGSRWFTAIRALRHLESLWSDLVAAFPFVALHTSAPLTVSRAELRCDRHFVEVADGLATATIDVEHRAALSPSVLEVAALLRETKGRWNAEDGLPVAKLLPPVRAASEERDQLIALADAYRRGRATARRPTLSGLAS